MAWGRQTGISLCHCASATGEPGRIKNEINVFAIINIKSYQKVTAPRHENRNATHEGAPEAQAQHYADYDARFALKHHCTDINTFSVALLLTPAWATHCGGSGQLFVDESFLSRFFDCGNAEFWRVDEKNGSGTHPLPFPISLIKRYEAAWAE
ncbi:hypothetical protein DFH08DRAFT_806272 [Mycena albidolilacea]|uniref:Uncharacterized protein n=1 Tax=Mycena albidolilacea TaxID=1033008 RepID=A0AAD7A7X5_9AGAR|nr:hypothetical protein DFH08DRAFT_806272 [Mycena albidolilacea]